MTTQPSFGGRKPPQCDENEGARLGLRLHRGHTLPKGLRHGHKGTLFRLVVSLAAFASLASLAGGFFDGL